VVLAKESGPERTRKLLGEAPSIGGVSSFGEGYAFPVAKRTSPSAKATPKPEEFETFERGLRKVLSVSKKDLDEALKREKEARTNGNGKAH
jgi:hypothetical protein